jgi:chromosome segregation ATPase
MDQEKEFLTLEELSQQSHDFKKKWYGLSEKAEGLTNFKSGFEEGFKENIKVIYEDIDSCKDYIDGFEHSLKHYFPDHRSDITWMTKKVFRHFEELRVMAKKDFDVLENSKDLAQSLKALIEDRDKAEAKLKVAETQSGEACRKYFDMKNEYTAEYQSIEDKLKKQMEKIREKFIEMTTPIVEGHDISLASRRVTISELFELLGEKPGDSEKISLVVKKGGIFGKKAETDLAKTSVLKYVAGEILDGVQPINKEKKKLIEKLKSEYSELPKLEKACEESETQRKKLEKPVEAVRSKIGEIKKSEVFKFVDYDGILETREQYLDKIGDGEKEVKEYLDFALLNLKGFVELEQDVEKRNLLSEIKTAKEQAAINEKEAAKAREDLNAKKKELTSVTASKEDLEKKLVDTAERQGAAESETAEIKKRIEDINKKVKVFERTVLSNLKKFESDVESKLSEINSAMETKTGKGKEVKKVEKKLDSLRGKSKK